MHTFYAIGRKIREDENYVYYSFGESLKQQLCEFKISKITKESILLKASNKTKDKILMLKLASKVNSMYLCRDLEYPDIIEYC